jgi:hypothetical protein
MLTPVISGEEQAYMASTEHMQQYRFRPGQSGNPRGRPRGRSLTNALRTIGEREHLRNADDPNSGVTPIDALAQLIWREALNKDFRYVRLVAEYLDGKPTPILEAAIQNDDGVELLRRFITGEAGPADEADPAGG